MNSEHEVTPFIANDGCRIRELLHPYNESIDLGFSLAIAEVDAFGETYRHRLHQAEVYYIISGTGMMHIDEETREVHVGDAVFIPPGAVQWIENIQDSALKFAAMVAPPWRAEDDQRL